ncbi:PLP-dependent aminotransferase family protein [Pantoea eucalypti]|uniref:MocR-like pyridoxine biosynthesis transcription factor PdxR n=1 Tax=Pantoea TaxID=53335 RepID=UPI00099A1298|nr:MULTISPECIES: PLP-dependent aminotransferase family protein [Pantoea]AWP34109.1 PLP-dependent aminotransferase family protein [Pantoea vagans]SJZ84712.1 GntR family transcriptional regulator / MocR family aminotransferase [Pantoea eucalypti]
MKPQIPPLLLAPLIPAGGTTLQQQLYQRIKQGILQGQLAAGTGLPSTRQLALELQVSRNTVLNVWTQLQAEGYLMSDRQGSRISSLALPARQADDDTLASWPLAKRMDPFYLSQWADTGSLPLRPGIPALNHFPMAAWRRALSQVTHHTPPQLLGYGDPLGDPELRAVLAQQLRITRGVRCDAGQIVITEGVQQALTLCVALLSNPGDHGWIEDPGYRGAKAALQGGELNVIPISTDHQGLAPQPIHWEQTPPRLIYTTPTHQYPTGAVMSASRRLALIAAAQQHQAWIIEDDYDGDFHYHGEPIMAMQGMTDNAPVIYLGSFSKTLFPALRIGFMVLPAPLVKRLRPALHQILRGGNRLEQQALTRFILNGDYRRHLGKMRRLYRQRQALLRTGLQRAAGQAISLLGGNSGMHLVLPLEPHRDDVAITRKLHQAGYAPGALSTFYLTEPVQQGLVIGYGNCRDTQITAATGQLSRLLGWPG